MTMQNDWILDVLADLKSFATANGMTNLAEQLDDATLIAAAEIASQAENARGRLQDNATGRPEQDSRGAGRHQRA
ncbi:hypothetical protein [Marinibacterium profundimaris]|uniref:hypothetical protein n=1 Tax=Marinibacterium profundimaris TaxID=1679460 RepID=UPI001302FC6C|nr:hypothetical protein [Marinibacterium profundimaris]